MAIGDTTELLAMSNDDDSLEVFATWQEIGTFEHKGVELPQLALISIRVVNVTDAPATLLVSSAAGNSYWFTVAPPGDTFTFDAAQREDLASGAAISVTEG